MVVMALSREMESGNSVASVWVKIPKGEARMDTHIKSTMMTSATIQPPASSRFISALPAAIPARMAASEARFRLSAILRALRRASSAMCRAAFSAFFAAVCFAMSAARVLICAACAAD